MLSASKIKLIQSLKLKKFRQKYNLFVAEGSKLYKTLIHQKRYRIRDIYATEKGLAMAGMTSFTDGIQVIDERQMNKISFLKNSSDILCLIEIPDQSQVPAFKKALFLDGIQDPGNVGSIIRTADWFGIEAVFRSGDTADFYNPKVVQATMGSFANVGLYDGDLGRLHAGVQDLCIITADMHGEASEAAVFKEPACLVIGSEGAGLSANARDLADIQVAIPGHESRLAESLNASLAAGILCHSFFNNL